MKTEKSSIIFQHPLSQADSGKPSQLKKKRKLSRDSLFSAAQDDLVVSSNNKNRDLQLPGGGMGHRHFLSQAVRMPEAVESNRGVKALIEIQVVTDPITDQFMAELHLQKENGQRYIVACVFFTDDGFEITVDPSSPVGRHNWAPSHLDLSAAVDAAKGRLAPLRGH